MKDVDWAYLAGFIDADGSIMISKCGRKNEPVRYTLRLTITNTKQSIMDWLATELGGKVYLLNRLAPKRQNTVWRWVVASRACGPILFNAIPYLRLKTKQAEFALRFIGTLNNPGENRPLTKQAIAQREHIATHMRRMNKKGRVR